MSNAGFFKGALLCAVRYLRADIGFFVLLVLLLAVPSVLADTMLNEPDARAANLPIALFNSYFQLVTTFRVLNANGAAPAGYHRQGLAEGRFPSWFATSLLASLAILLASLLLVIPGIVLFLLFSLAMPALAAERLSARAALKRSWQLARPSLLPLLFLTLTIIAAVALLIVPIGIAADLLSSNNVLVIFTDVALPVITLFGATIWAGAYLEARIRELPAIDAATPPSA